MKAITRYTGVRASQRPARAANDSCEDDSFLGGSHRPPS